MKFIFGPVASRRFGTSLGIDLSPDTKQCNFDCLYCELAPAQTISSYTKVYTPQEIVEELEVSLKEHPNTEVITLTANGEPSLYPHLDELIKKIDLIKNDKQTLILTNSATLSNEKTYQSLLNLDQVKLSLDAVSTEVFRKIDRPHEDIDLSRLVQSVISFSKEYTGRLFIEVLFVKELNDTKEEIQAINTVLEKVNCERIDLGTIDRPPAYQIEGISYERLFEISHQFNPALPIHIASRKSVTSKPSSYTQEEIINTLDKRPLTRVDIELLFDEESIKLFDYLLKKDILSSKNISNMEFFIPSSNQQRKRKK
ncbi:radical SAM protein [Sulfurimonas sp. MAG313]|nr:radical SAM protein [Sulfurimonas sp. MAG313]MDF1880168.1 radical SAM protein [Sulfurimonas sp. MAG313]